MRSARILDKGIKSRTIRKRRREEKDTNRRLQTILFLVAAIVILTAVTVAGVMTEGYAAETDFSRRNLAPDLQHPFGTDWMGRDMLARTLAGLSLSIRIGVLTAAVSAAVALLLGTASVVFGRKADAVISWCIDLVMGIPHILLLAPDGTILARNLRGEAIGQTIENYLKEHPELSKQ